MWVGLYKKISSLLFSCIPHSSYSGIVFLKMMYIIINSPQIWREVSLLHPHRVAMTSVLEGHMRQLDISTLKEALSRLKYAILNTWSVDDVTSRHIAPLTISASTTNHRWFVGKELCSPYDVRLRIYNNERLLSVRIDKQFMTQRKSDCESNKDGVTDV